MTPFFAPAELEFFAKRLATSAGRVYRKARPQDEVDGHRIRAGVYAPTNEWARRVAEQLTSYRVIADNRWLIGGGYFKQYSWARLYLDEFGDEGIYFTLGVSSNGDLIYKIDFQFGGDDPLSAEVQSRLRTALAKNGVKWQRISLVHLPKYGGTWEQLIAETLAFTQQQGPLFRQLHELLTEPAKPGEEDVAAKNVAFAAKFPNPNIILYGPPGTGKTHHTLELAYELLMGEPPASYALAQELFQQELGKRVEFVTFHQSFGYEDFVQDIKPKVDDKGQLVFELKNGIFYEVARRARDEFNQQDQPDRPGRMPFDVVFDRLVQPLEVNGEEVVVKMKTDKYTFQLIALTDTYLRFRRHENKTESNLKRETLRSLYEGAIGYKQGGLQLYYEYVVNRLKELADEIKREESSAHLQAGTGEVAPPRNYVLIIDEINRANISKVFGELITLLEKDKRLGGDNPLFVTLPSGEAKFNVPANLYLIGTMNTADKSIALLDIALRRRFEFQALYPIYAQADGTPFQHATAFRQLNINISEQKSRDFQIGHAYFMDRPNKPAEPLTDILNKKVIPLLYEYFLNDAKKVKAVFKDTGLEIQEDQTTGLLRYSPVV